MAPTVPRWTEVTGITGQNPKPRHGHRAVSIKELIVVFGGGNEGIINELQVFNTITNNWFVPAIKGEMPEGCASYGMVVDNTRILIFGGMVENARYSNDLFELQASRWEWRSLRPKTQHDQPPPCARFGHSFNLIGNKVYLFGGIVNRFDGPHDPDRPVYKLEYLHDLYILELRNNNSTAWIKPCVYGTPPHPRESHTAVTHVDSEGNSKLIIYGGMCGIRLGDVWMLDIDAMTWNECIVGGVPPLPRSIHTATVVGEKMYVFGGWVPILLDDHRSPNAQKEYKCSNQVLCLNLKLMVWENLKMDGSGENIPKARAGHCAVNVNDRIYVWSGRDGYRKAWTHQVCYKDMWYLEVNRPSSIQGKVQLVKAATNALELSWPALPNVEYHLLQAQKFILPPSVSTQPMQLLSKAPESESANLLPEVSTVMTPGWDPISHSSQLVRPALKPAIRQAKAKNKPVSTPSASLTSPPMKPIMSPTTPRQGKIARTSVTPQNTIKSPSAQLIFQKPFLLEQSQNIAVLKTNKGVTLPSVSTTTNRSGISSQTTGSNQDTNVVRVVNAPTNPQVNSKLLTKMKFVPSKLVSVRKNAKQTVIVNKPGIRMPSGQFIVVTTGTMIKPITTLTTVQSSADKVNSPVKMLMMNSNPSSSSIGTPIMIKVPGSEVTKMFTITGKTSIGSPSQILQQAADQGFQSARILIGDNIMASSSTSAISNEKQGLSNYEAINYNDRMLPQNPVSYLAEPSLIKSNLENNDSPSPMAVSTIKSVFETASMMGEINAIKTENIDEEMLNTSKNEDLAYSRFATSTHPDQNIRPTSHMFMNQDDGLITLANAASNILEQLPIDEGQRLKIKSDQEPSSHEALQVPRQDFRAVQQPRFAEPQIVHEVPSAPTAIKISMCDEGANVSWTAPKCKHEAITAYSLSLAVKHATPASLGFVRIYLGPETQTIVKHSALSEAIIDTSAKPAIIFRIAAKNRHGFGPATQERAYLEVSEAFAHNTPLSIELLNNLKYLDRFIKEVLRLYPPVPMVGREVCKDIKLPSGYLIPAKSIAIVAIGGIHQNENYHKDPSHFDPDRFLPENMAKRHPYSYVPFSAGPRNCIGQKFAILELKASLSLILLNYEIGTTEDSLYEAFLTLQSKNGHNVWLKTRCAV